MLGRLIKRAALPLLMMQALMMQLGACAAPVVAPPDGGRCGKLDTWAEARRAVAALNVVPFRAAQMYDVGADGKPAYFQPARASTMAKAIITFPAPNRFPGAPAGFQRLANRSYTYDNALYALWATEQGDQTAAAAVLETLSVLQREDGAWGFSFDARGGRFYNAGYVRTGVVAWTVLAFARFQARFGDQRFAEALGKGAGWLWARRHPQWGLLLGGLGRWIDDGKTFEPGHVANWASTEHNVDGYFALKAAAEAGISGYSHENLGARAAAKLFLAAQGRYAQGWQPSGPDRISALDAAGTWSALFDVARGDKARAQQVLGWVEREHRSHDGGWRGYKPYQQGPDVWFVEGSLALALARHRLGDTAAARRLTAEVAALSCVGRRPVLYATRWAKDFPATPVAAPTLWFALVAAEVDAGRPAFLWR